MSGIQEWKNCVALYVNVGDKHGNAYDNVFTRAGSRITWFAQPRQDEDSPVIKSIMKTSTLEEESVEDAMTRAENGEEAAPKYVDWPLHLFCRMGGARDARRDARPRADASNRHQDDAPTTTTTTTRAMARRTRRDDDDDARANVTDEIATTTTTTTTACWTRWRRA